MTRVHVVVGLCWGDEGKGTTVDWLVHETSAAGVVRFNGGPQAAHHVVVDGHVHCFAQFGAGTFAGARTFLAAPVASDLLALAREASALAAAGVSEPLARVTIHPDVILVTPWHKLLNRLAEVLRGSARHGSCGMGVGQALLDAEKPAMPTVRMREVEDPDVLRRGLHRLWLTKVDQAEQALAAAVTAFGAQDDGVLSEEDIEEGRAIVGDVRDRSRLDALVAEYQAIAAQLRVGDALPDLLASGHVVFEGAQGVLLDRVHGDFPFVTPSYVTPDRALALLAPHVDRAEVRVVGVTRTYATRHGPGPFPTEDPALGGVWPELHNGKNPWQGPMRIGLLHLPSVARGIAACAGEVDALSVTCADRVEETLPALRGLGLPLDVVSYGLEAGDKRPG